MMKMRKANKPTAKIAPPVPPPKMSEFQRTARADEESVS
jgi:hypothetical protein